MANRFRDFSIPGSYYDPFYLDSLSDAELVREIKNSDSWDMDLLRELCWRAGLIDEWEESDGDTFEDVAFKAAEKLGVEID